MNKIPTVFARDESDRKYVLPDVTPGCEWVLAGEGLATRKYDGTCVMLDEDGNWWARREVKKGKKIPDDFRMISADPNTGKVMGWEPIHRSSFLNFHTEALIEHAPTQPGTYELIGPKINGNPEKVERHMLMPHAQAEILGEFRISSEDGDRHRSFDMIRATLRVYAAQGYEGIVYHHPDGRMAKIKVRDFRS
jgi:hypothetical protein